VVKHTEWVPPPNSGHPLQYEFCVRRGEPKSKANRWAFSTHSTLYVKRRGYRMMLHPNAEMGPGPHEIISVRPRGVSANKWIRRQSA
jgi:hypothetical protein